MYRPFAHAFAYAIKQTPYAFVAKIILCMFYSMVSYGIVWCGFVWYGMVWYGIVWYSLVWYGMVWYVWYGMV